MDVFVKILKLWNHRKIYHIRKEQMDKMVSTYTTTIESTKYFTLNNNYKRFSIMYRFSI